jgi:predicted metal-dependent hydrolase
VQTSNPDRKVPTRRISFDESLQTLPKHFGKDGDLISSHLMAVMSSLFPEGEDFFVRSVRHYRDRITDPELKRQVAGFIGQEAIHGREHRALNDRLAELGYPTHEIDRGVKVALALRWKYLPKKSSLAITAALEHFTATLAELALSDEEARAQFGNPEVRNLLLWHALEESEHKAVAFDVYRAVGGSEAVRIWTMQVIRFGFVVLTSILTAVRTSWREFKRSPMMRKELWLQLKDYTRRDFHPDDRDTTALVEQWRDQLFGEHGTLNDRLVTRVAA